MGFLVLVKSQIGIQCTKIEGVVFDFNRLSLDTETPELKSLEYLYIKFEITFPVKI